jgi:mannose-1-phosphate guanylyltransferase/phosphomannomutase
LGIQFNGTWFDVGQKRDYLRVNEALLDGKIDIAMPYEKHSWGYCGANVAMPLDKVTLVPPVVIGDNCTIEAGATLGPYTVIGDGWTIESGARVRNSVLWGRYPYFARDGREMDTSRGMDRHLVRKGASVSESIVVGGTLEGELHEKTVNYEENGDVSVLSIDNVPEGPRA